MKYNLLLALLITLGTALITAFDPPASTADKEALLMKTMLNSLNQLHFAPQKIDDDFSRKAFDLYLERLDGSRRWLTVSDVLELRKYETELDDAANDGNYEFLDKSVLFVQRGIDKTQDWYRELLDEPMDFTVNEDVELDGEKMPFASTDAELRERWRKLVKYEVLTRLADKQERREKEEEDYAGKTDAEFETEARQEVREMFDKWYERLGKMKRTDYLSTYLNSFTNIFDPHTSYYEPIEKQNFDISMSGRLEGIGARLQTDGNYTKVTDVVAGGPAFKQGDLTVGDKISKVAQGADGEWTDVTGMSINDVVQLIRGKKGTIVKLQVKKIEGDVENIIITRDVVEMEEGFAKSLLLDSPNGKQVGYIHLPRFYADFQDRNGRQSSRDIGREIEKVKAEGAEGIILDLRNNGGGSLRDVVKMTGFFIEEGPVVQVKSRGHEAEVLEDNDRKQVLWDGALVVMVNEFSASASEILAAALQDYERAIIVGTPTFGKGTVQRFWNLDRGVRNQPEVLPLGEIKLTTQKFYRVNGGSTQLRGVTPDIILPDNYRYLETGEQETEYPLEWTSIPAAKEYGQEVYDLDDKDKLVRKAERRIESNETFQKIDANARRWRTDRDDTTEPLNLATYRTQRATEKERNEVYKKLFDAEVLTNVRNLDADQDAIASDEGATARNEKWTKGVRKDVHLLETLHIMDDMLK